MIRTEPQAASVRIPLARPDITDLERESVMRVLQTPTLSLGPELTAFEQELAAVAGTRHAVAVNSGTSALHLAMLALDIGPGDEVITTPFSFIASSNCIAMAGARPVFADIDPLTLALDPGLAEGKITPRTKAILAVDVFGHPADWDGLREVADRHGIALVEDSAEAIGAAYKGRPAGSLGDVGIFAFYPNKQITTGEGGALLTDDQEMAARVRSLRNQGRGEGGGWLAHERLGYNYRLPEMSCALGRAQLQRLPELLCAREQVAARYTEALRSVPGVMTHYVSPDVTMSWFVYVIRLAPEYSRAGRDRVLTHLRREGIGASNYFPSIHLEPFYGTDFGYEPGDFPISEAVSDRTLALPFYGSLTDDDAAEVVATLRDALAAL